jgi:hypothetical protein
MTKDKDEKLNVNDAFPTDEGLTLAALKTKLAEYEAQITASAAEEKALELEERKLRIIDMKENQAKRSQEAATRKQQAENRMAQIMQQIKAKEAVQKFCTHMKGGVVTQSNRNVVMSGQGNDATDYCVIKHVLPSGRLLILCLRCGLEEYSRDPLTGEKATSGFATAARWPTKNQNSGSSQFWPIRDIPTFPNAGEIAKEQVR